MFLLGTTSFKILVALLSNLNLLLTLRRDFSDHDHGDDHDDHDGEHDFHVYVRLQYGFRGRVQRGHDVRVHRDHGCHGVLRDHVPRDHVPRDHVPRDHVPRDHVPRDHVPRVFGCHGDDHVLHDRGSHVHVLPHDDGDHFHVSSR